MSAVLAVWNDVDSDNEAEFNEWYIRQHVPERVGVPGFRNGRRHLALSSADPSCPRNFTFYEVDDLNVLQSAPYLRCLDQPTDWTQRTMPWFRNMSRTACQVVCRAGQGHGAFAGTMRLRVDESRREGFDGWVQRGLFPTMLEIPGLVSAQCWRGDAAATAVDSTEGSLRHGRDGAIAAAFMVSATHAGALVNAAALIRQDTLAAHGVSTGGPGGLQLYQLVYALDSRS